MNPDTPQQRPGADEASQFLDDILSRFFAVIHDHPDNNYDAERFSFDGIDRSGDFEPSAHKDYLQFLIRNHGALHDACGLLEDDRSRKTFVDLLLFRLAGHLHVRLDTNNKEHWDARERARRLSSTRSQLRYEGMFGPLQHFEDVPCNGSFLAVDCWPLNVAWTFFLRQYFFERGGVAIRAEPGDHVIDAGACFGDTALAFAASVGVSGRVYTFETLDTHLEIIRHNLRQNPRFANVIDVFPFGLGDTSNPDAKPIGTDGVLAPGFTLHGIDDEDLLPVRTVDDLVWSGDIDKVDFIKMDIEGYELKALHGAEETIRRFKPKLAVSIYHRPQEMYEIPAFLADLGVGYAFYLEHYTIHREETVLYAVSRSRASAEG